MSRDKSVSDVPRHHMLAYEPAAHPHPNRHHECQRCPETKVLAMSRDTTCLVVTAILGVDGLTRRGRVGGTHTEVRTGDRPPRARAAAAPGRSCPRSDMAGRRPARRRAGLSIGRRRRRRDPVRSRHRAWSLWPGVITTRALRRSVDNCLPAGRRLTCGRRRCGRGGGCRRSRGGCGLGCRRGLGRSGGGRLLNRGGRDDCLGDGMSRGRNHRSRSGD